MTENQVFDLFEIIDIYSPGFASEDRVEALAAIWSLHLQDLDSKTAASIVHAHYAKETRWIMPADIRRHAARIAGVLPPDADAGHRRKGRQFPPCPGCRHGRNETIMDRLFPGPGDDRSTGLSREAHAVSSTFYPHQIGGPLAEALAWHDKIGQAEVDMLVDKHRLHQWNLHDVVELPEPHELSDDGHPVRYRRVRNDRPTPTAAEVNAAENAHHVHDGINRSYLVQTEPDR